jgi:hypothetical protein
VVAVAIISIAAVAILGGLLGSTSASATHRNLTTLDGVLKSFSEAARYEIQTQPNLGASGPQFVPCATFSNGDPSPPYTYNPYRVVGSPYPTTGVTGGWLTFFGLGFSGLTGTPKLVNTTTGATTPLTGGQFTGGISGAIVSFPVPTSLTTNSSYTAYPFDGSTPANAPFKVTGTGGNTSGPAPYATYSLATTIAYWNGSTFQPTPCAVGANSTLQQLTFTLTNSQQGNAGSDQVQIVVGNFGALALPTVQVTGTNASLGGTVTFTATVSGASPTPTGQINWAFAGSSPGTPTCSSTTLAANGTAICQVTPALAGTYTVTATYGGDSHYTVGQGSASATVTPGNPTVGVTANSTPTPAVAGPGTTLTFQASVTGVVAVPPSGGTITWTFPGGTPAGTRNCPSVTFTGNPVQCTVTGPSAGTFAPTATYSGDSNYNSGTGSTSISVAQAVATVSVTTTSSNPSPLGSTLTFQASVSGNGPTPSGGTVTWTFPAGTPAGTQTCPPVTLPTNNPITCSITGSAAGTFAPKATYSGDTNYPTTSGSASVVVSKGQPTVTVTGTPGTTGNGNKIQHDIKFTVTITGAAITAPTGTGTWTFSPSSPGTWNCPSLTLPATTTCVVTSPQSGTQYTATLTYTPAAGDTNYLPASGSKTVTAP